MSVIRPFAAAAVLAAAAATLPACAPVRSHQGYIVDVDLVNALQPGVDNRQSVAATLGRPSISGQFGQGDWYYVARDSANLAFRNPRPSSQITIQISFDPAGTVTAVRRGGLDQVASISPSRKETPTLGKSRGFFQELFGNIGTVGAPGAAGGGGGAGRTQP